MKAIIPIMMIAAVIAGCERNKQKPAALRDLKDLKQDAFAYVDPATLGLALVPPQVQQKFYEEFQRAYFAPWQDLPAADIQSVRRPFERFTKAPGFGQNSVRRTPEFAQRLLEQSAIAEFPNRDMPAITIANADLREMPTIEPIFADLPGTADGYPFDLLQASTLPAGNPIHVCHITPDGQWAFVISNCGHGWLEQKNFAFVDDAAKSIWQRPANVAILKDGLAMRDIEGQFHFTANVGAVFPLASGDEKSGLAVSIPVAGARQKVEFRRVKLNPGEAAIMPLPLTRNNIAKIANLMLGQPYGWGGMYGSRDCSATTRDLFMPFGLLLPRNSAQQAQLGEVVSLKGISSRQRERLIVEKGVPWLTLVRYPGHIMLYIAQVNGRPLVLHNFWGIKTRDAAGEGRFIVGKCAITTLTPGDELSDLAQPDGLIVNRIDSFIILPPALEGRSECSASQSK